MTFPAPALTPVRLRQSRFFTLAILFALLATLCVAQAEGPDDDYLAIYGVIERADALAASGKTTQAHAKYVEAQKALYAFKLANPGWNVKTVSFRQNYLADKITATSGQTAAPETSVPAAGTKPAMSAAKSPVKLLAAGSEPRTVLRLHPSVGDQQTMLMTLKMSMEMGAAGNQMPAINIPAMVMTIAVTVKDVSSTGDIAYDLEYTDATVATDPGIDPAMATALKSALGGLKGITGSAKVSSQGIVSGLAMKLPAKADPQLGQTMDQMKDSLSGAAIALPDEAVGPGAKWEYKTKIKSQGMNIDQTFSYELVTVDGDRLTLRNILTQTAANQKVESPAMPGMKVDLVKMTSMGAGNVTLDLRKVLPVTSTMHEKSESSMGMNVGQQKQTMDTKMTMKVTMETK